ncbi:MAG TPA: fasciclin domain-containing protein [Solirubrobacteraceae bacterium]|nr:fasciclin domain-containing protein [Solirubrobacteraceae bacterium]
MKRIALLLAAVLAAVAVAAPASAGAKSNTIVDVAAGNPQFSTLVSLVKKAGLVGALSGKTKLTVFAPTNAAFAKLPKATLNKVASDKKLLTSILTYHVVKGAVPASKVVKLNGKSVKTLNGQSVQIKVKGGSVYVNSAKVVKTDVKASNGIIHVIDSVLIPKS